MRIIITESQSKILWLRRRLNDPEITFINSYTELSGDVYVEDNELEKFVREIVISKHRSRIEREYRDRDCDEEEEEEDDKTEWWVDK